MQTISDVFIAIGFARIDSISNKQNPVSMMPIYDVSNDAVSKLSYTALNDSMIDEWELKWSRVT